LCPCDSFIFCPGEVPHRSLIRKEGLVQTSNNLPKAREAIVDLLVQREVEVARARVDEAQQALIKELDRAKERERQAAAERAAASRDWAVQEQAAARDRAAAQRAMQAAAAQARSLTSQSYFM
jgi:hypothetical protein